MRAFVPSHCFHPRLSAASTLNTRLVAGLLKDASFPSLHVRHFSSLKPSDDFNAPKKRGRLWGTLVTAGVWGSMLLGKTKYIFVGLKLLKFSSLISLVASVGAYSFVFGAPFAIGR